ncbi:hypothetical protein GCM10009767_28680 [Kocuria aegyptia]|uniref:Uncharacterized protein n=1 Tax=Kocuria aegyptia TaxID=330943 RepID=A0ABN2KXL5_9MICC
MKFAVWVMNPGPMALVAIRKRAPSRAERFMARIAAGVLTDPRPSGAGGTGAVLDMRPPRDGCDLRRGRSPATQDVAAVTVLPV